MANQPLAFGALLAGGLLITAGLSGKPLRSVATGQVSTLSDPTGTVRIDSGLASAVNSSAGSIAGAIDKTALGGVQGLVNPFAGAMSHLSVERVDMGQDYALQPGDPIGAIGLSRIVDIVPNWFQGQPYLYGQLLNEHGGTTPTAASPHAGELWYVAEQINPTVKAGDIVQAGQQVATYASSGTGIEYGWASSTPGRTLAASRGDVNLTSHYSAEGQAFADLMKQLGV